MISRESALNDLHNSDLVKISGCVRSSDPLVSFLYQLMRDHVNPGLLEKILRECLEEQQEITFSNGWLAQYAESIAARLLPVAKIV